MNYKWLRSAVSLKPYEDSLLSPQGNFWIGFVRLIVGAMAMVEGSSWSYIGSFLGTTPLTSFIFGIFLGVIVFIFVWAVDVSLMSLDVDAYRHTLQKPKEDELYGETSTLSFNSSDSQTSASYKHLLSFNKIVEYLKWPIIPVGWRSILVIISVLVCAPFISMYVLRSDIDHELEARFQVRLEQIKNEKLAARSHELKENYKQVAAAQIESQQRYESWVDANNIYRREVAGTGESRRHGDGAAAKAALLVSKSAEAEYKVAQARLQELKKNQDVTNSGNEIIELEKAAQANDFNTLRIRYGIQEIPNSFLARNSVLKSFEGKPEFKRIEYSVYSLLTFLVMALFLLKYFEPATVRIYFSEARQSIWREYNHGVYDYLLEEKHKSSARKSGGMTVLFFCELWDNVIAPALADKDYTKAMAKVQLVKDENENRLKRIRTLRESILNTEKAIDERQKELEIVSHEHTRLVEAVNELRRLEKNLISSLERETSDEVLPDINDRLEEIKNSINEKTSSVNNSHSKKTSANVDLVLLNKELAQHTKTLSRLEAELAPVLALLKETEAKQLELAKVALQRVTAKK